MRGDEFLRELAREIPGFDDAHPEIDVPFDLAKNVYRLRNDRGLTQEALARAARTRQPRIAEIERGDANPRLDTLARIAEALGVSVAELFAARDEAVVAESPRLAVPISSTRVVPKLEDEWQGVLSSPFAYVADDPTCLSA